MSGFLGKKFIDRELNFLYMITKKRNMQEFFSDNKKGNKKTTHPVARRVHGGGRSSSWTNH
jgi:hypothetical protein